MEGTHWYHAEEGRAVGPLSEAQLVALVKLGKINGDTLIWKPGEEVWKKLTEAQPSFLKPVAQNAQMSPVQKVKEEPKKLWNRLFGRS